MYCKIKCHWKSEVLIVSFRRDWPFYCVCISARWHITTRSKQFWLKGQCLLKIVCLTYVICMH